MKIIFRKWHVGTGIKLAVVFFSLFFLASSGIANEDIFSIIEQGDIDSVEKFITEANDVDIRNENGRTPLHNAAYYGSVEIAELLVNASADVNAKDNDGQAPLHSALRLPREDNEAFRADLLKNKVQIIELLLLSGTDVNAQDNEGMTPLIHFAAAFSRVKHNTQIISQILEAFSKSNINLNVQDIEGFTALSVAASKQHEDIVA